MKIFTITPETTKTTAVLAQNQGLHNGFLAVGLIWSFFIEDERFKNSLRIFSSAAWS